jgi:NitT/TauT family transport system substrate-binding protein
MPVIKKVLLAMVLISIGLSAKAEVNEIKIAEMFGVSYLPLMVMERNQLLEKRAKAAGLGDLKVTWVKLAGPSVINDGLITGSLHFAALGPTSMITLWAKTKDNRGIKGVAAMTTCPLYLNTRNANVKSIMDFSEKDKIVVPSIKVSNQAILLQMAAAKAWGDENYARLDRFTVALSHPDGLLALTNNTGGVDAHFTASPFHEQELKIPGVRNLTSSYEILGGRATAALIAASSKFREDNPKVYRAFFDAFSEAIDTINKDKRAAARLYLEQAKDTKDSAEEIFNVINHPDYAYTLTPEKIQKTAEFMYKIGTIKVRPVSWKEMFFPEVHKLQGD